jgi:hypothetical protein
MLCFIQAIHIKTFGGLLMKLLSWIVSEMEKRDKMIKRATLFGTVK